MRRWRRRGVTLVELVIAILLIGLMATVAGLSVPRAERTRSKNSLRPGISAIRESAIDSGSAITRVIMLRGVPYTVTALPNGSVIADSSLLVDRLSGVILSPDRERPARDAHAPHNPSGQ